MFPLPAAVSAPADTLRGSVRHIQYSFLVRGKKIEYGTLFYALVLGAQTLQGRLFQLDLSFAVLIIAMVVAFFHLKHETMDLKHETMDLKHTMKDGFAKLSAQLEKMKSNTSPC